MSQSQTRHRDQQGTWSLGRTLCRRSRGRLGERRPGRRILVRRLDSYWECILWVLVAVLRRMEECGKFAFHSGRLTIMREDKLGSRKRKKKKKERQKASEDYKTITTIARRRRKTARQRKGMDGWLQASRS